MRLEMRVKQLLRVVTLWHEYITCHFSGYISEQVLYTLHACYSLSLLLLEQAGEKHAIEMYSTFFRLTQA